MYPKPQTTSDISQEAKENTPIVFPTGFREYDARWLFPEQINLLGVQTLGAGLGTLLKRRKVEPGVIVGHDYRSYSLSIKQALICGLMSAGASVKDIGLSLSPMAYYAQFALDVPSVAMVTASHNDNGWTGVKMGCDKPMTFGPDEMAELKSIVLQGDFETGNGDYEFIEDFKDRYIENIIDRKKLRRPIKAVVACGNGTAGAFAPLILEQLGVDVIPLDCELDHSFPRYNPNPEDMAMLSAIKEKVLETGAEVGLAFDGDGDRCGVVDNNGDAIFADKAGVMLARDLSKSHSNARFVADVKSTSLFMTDPVLQANGAKTEYWKTGHSYIKRRSHETSALAGFEKSGHFFFNKPIGLGYDDGLIAALAVLDMMDNNPGQTLADLQNALPKTWQSPTMSPHCADEVKYDVVDRVTKYFQRQAANGEKIAGQDIREMITINGIRVVLKDGTWGLVRASSNKPELVVVVESPTSEENMLAMFKNIDTHLSQYDEVGEYNQKI